MRNLLILLLSLTSLPAFADDRSFAITGVTVHTEQVNAPAIENGVIIVINGKIACLGVQMVAAKASHALQQKVCQVPADVQAFAFAGKIVIPGQFEALGRLGQIEVDAEDSTHDGVAAHQQSRACARDRRCANGLAGARRVAQGRDCRNAGSASRRRAHRRSKYGIPLAGHGDRRRAHPITSRHSRQFGRRGQDRSAARGCALGPNCAAADAT